MNAVGRSAPPGEPQLRVGIVSDVQYADVDDATNFVGNRWRKYRQSLEILGMAAEEFESIGGVRIAVQLGDMLDGKAAMNGKDGSRAALEDVRRVLRRGSLGRIKGGWRACVGNHELYNFGREELAKEDLYWEGDVVVDDDGGEPRLYYSTRPAEGWKLVFLDAYAISIMGDQRGPRGRQLAARELSANNPNIDADDPMKPGSGWLLGIEGTDVRYVPYNGALGARQLQWLQREVYQSSRDGERVLIFCHQPFFLAASKANNMPWDFEEVGQIVAERNGVVAAVFAGHDHDGGYAEDAGGTHHLVPAAPLECADGEVSFGHLDCYEDRLVLHWRGKTPPGCSWPREMRLRPFARAGLQAMSKL